MSTTTRTHDRFAIYSTAYPLEFWLRTTKSGTVRAYYGLDRTRPLPLRDAKRLEAEGRGIEIPMPWWEQV